MILPEPEEYGGEPAYDIELMIIAARIVLMTILILLIDEIKDSDFAIDEDTFIMTDTINAPSAVAYLKNLCVTA